MWCFFHDAAAKEDAWSSGTCLDMPLWQLSIPKLPESQGTVSSWDAVQNTCFRRVCSLQENVVHAPAPCPSLQGLRMQRAEMQVCWCFSLLFRHLALCLIWNNTLTTYGNYTLCRDLKEHLRRLQQQSDSRRRAAVNEMMRQRAAEVAANE